MNKERILAIRATMAGNVSIETAREIIAELLSAVDKSKKKKADDDEPPLFDLQQAPTKKARGTLEEFQAFAESIQLPASDGEAMYWKFEANGWTNGGKPVKDWKATMRQWKAGKWHPSQQQRGRNGSNGHAQAKEEPKKCKL